MRYFCLVLHAHIDFVTMDTQISAVILRKTIATGLKIGNLDTIDLKTLNNCLATQQKQFCTHMHICSIVFYPRFC